MIVEFDPDARAELFEASDYYEQRRPGYGGRFIAAIAASVGRLGTSPDAGAIWRSELNPQVRRRRVAGFPSAWLAYVVLPDRVYVLAIVHTKRRPGYWANRLRRVVR